MPMNPMYNTAEFGQVFHDSQSFVDNWNDSEFQTVAHNQGYDLSDDFLRMTFLLLEARHERDPIANLSVCIFKKKVNRTLYAYGPACQKKIEVQKSLIAFTEDDVVEGNRVINNHAYNPSTEPSTQQLEEIEFTDAQDVQKIRKSKLDGYSNLVNLLEDDVVDTFISKFDNLFLKVVVPDITHVYCDEEDE